MALSDQQFNQFLLDAQDSTGFGINRYNELKDAGATNQQIAEIAANAPVIGPKAREALPELSDIFYTQIRNELETQYNNIVSIGKAQGKDVTYRGRSSDLPTIFNQQARQLADAGVSSVANLRLSEITVPVMSSFGGFTFSGDESGKVVQKRESRQVGTRTYQGLIDVTTGQPFKNTNLGGAVAIDRDTGAQKFGDIFSGVKGGANYGIQFAPDGSPILFPVWEKTKSPIAQIGMEFLEPIIEPIATAAGYYFGGPVVGTAVGNTVGQYLASGEVDAERVAIATAAAYAGSEIAGSMGGEVAGAPTPDGGIVGTPGVSTVYPVAPPNIGVATLPPQAAAGAGLTSAEMAALRGNAGYGETVQSLLNQDLAFVGEDAAQLYNTTGSVAATQQNLLAAGVDPTMAAEASNLAALGGTGTSIASSLGTAFPRETVFTSEGLLSSGATLDPIAKEIAGISTTGGSSIGVTDALRLANQAQGLFGQQPQMGGLLGGQRAGGQPMGVDYSGLLALLQARTGTPNVASLLAPAVNRYQPLTTQQSLLG